MRPADNLDWIRVFGAGRPPDVWVGIASDGAHTIDGLGGMYLADDGRWYVFFWRAAHVVAPMTTHKAARIIIETAREAGITLWAWQDPRVCTAERWLRRLGFTPTGERIEDEVAVWTL